jgi:hypothetical protein
MSGALASLAGTRTIPPGTRAPLPGAEAAGIGLPWVTAATPSMP